jgi:hypothetical protein
VRDQFTTTTSTPAKKSQYGGNGEERIYWQYGHHLSQLIPSIV